MFGLHKQFIQKDLFDILKSEIDFNQDIIVVGGHKIKEKRKTSWMSDFNYTYRYGEKLMSARAMTENVKYIQEITVKEKL